MSTFTPMCVVCDRTNALKIADKFTAVPSVHNHVLMWQKLGFAFVVLLFSTKERLNMGMPMVFMPNTTDKLGEAIDACCSLLSDIECKWIVCLDTKSLAHNIVTKKLLADAKTKGTS